jgi:hypothetical protein
MRSEIVLGFQDRRVYGFDVLLSVSNQLLCPKFLMIWHDTPDLHPLR